MVKGWERYSVFCRSRLRSWLIFAGVILGILGYIRPEFVNYLIGSAMMAPGVLLHFFCKANLQQNKYVTRSGPYRWVRHPFYLANLLIDFGLCVMIGRWEVAAIFGVCWIVAYTRQIRHEENTLLGLFGEEYRQYKKEVPAIFPWKVWPSQKVGETKFSLENPNIDTGKEGSRILRYASYPYLLFTSALIGQEGLQLLTKNSSWALIPPAAFLSLYWLSVVTRDFVRGKDSALAAIMERRSFRLILDILLIGILIFTEGLIPEINGLPFLFAMLIVTSLLFIPCLTIVLETHGKAFFSYRFQILFEMFFLIFLCSLGGLFYLSAVPIIFYIPHLIYGSRRTSEQRRLAIPIVTFDLSGFNLKPYHLVRGSLLSFGFALLFFQEIYHIHILSFL